MATPEVVFAKEAFKYLVEAIYQGLKKEEQKEDRLRYAPPRPSADQDREGYRLWRRSRNRPIREKGAAEVLARLESVIFPVSAPVKPEPRISILIPVHKPRLSDLYRLILSLKDQSLSDFEAVFCLNGEVGSLERALLMRTCACDPRFVLTSCETVGISKATNKAFEESSAPFVAFLDQDDTLEDHALETVLEKAEGYDLLYSDEDKIDLNGEYVEPFFKPDFSPELLLSTNYVCHLLVIRRELFEEVGGLNPDLDGAQDWDLILRLVDLRPSVAHVADVLYHWRKSRGSAALNLEEKPWAKEAQEKTVKAALLRASRDDEISPGPAPGTFLIKPRLTNKLKVSVVVPFKDEPLLLGNCVRSLALSPGNVDLEFVLVDNGSSDPEVDILLEVLNSSFNVKVLRDDAPFNWARLSNEGALHASGEVLVFANNDIEALTDRWAEALAAAAKRPEVGAVGARLLYPDGFVQHAGVILRLNGTADHAFRDLPKEAPGYFCLAKLNREVSAVTGALMAVKREIFEKLGGFDEGLRVAFNDVDFCLRIREEGLSNLYLAAVEFLHFESRSRGRAVDEDDASLFWSRWRHLESSTDPFFNPNLSRFNAWWGLNV